MYAQNGNWRGKILVFSGQQLIVISRLFYLSCLKCTRDRVLSGGKRNSGGNSKVVVFLGLDDVQNPRVQRWNYPANQNDCFRFLVSQLLIS